MANQKKTIQVFSDAGHAWVKVSIKELLMLGILSKMSCYSYERNGYAFLEEDQDAAIYLEDLKDRDYDLVFKVSHTDRSSKIRNYRRLNTLKYELCENIYKENSHCYAVAGEYNWNKVKNS